MPETPDEEKFISFRYKSVVAAADSTELHIETIGGNALPDEQREMLANAHGIDPDSVIIGEAEKKAYRRRTGRLAVGFTNWNSSWNPRGEQVDPTLN